LKGSIEGVYSEPWIGWGTRMYASSVSKNVSAKRINDRQRRNRPCILEEVILYLRQEIFAFLVGAVTIEITKRAEMRKVIGFVVLFFPRGLFACASGPLVDAALYLITTDRTRQHPGRGTWLQSLPP
jgi:hypothetical protein